ncbi:MAG: hypothetical protein EOO05_00090 [Chitinophagaceae bacterium]|nr:MAG: hypothetical protein EOO05_00090 [Chitinophagaceae bacterium]
MHKIAATILLLAFLGQTFNQGVYCLGYMIDKREYVKNCVNKARPMLHCNGKCQLMKKMMEAEKKSQQAPELKLAKSEIISSRSSFVYALPLMIITSGRHYIPFNPAAPVDRASTFFHPPNC